MTQTLWISLGLRVTGLGLTMEDTLLKIVVVLCGLISLILSITFGTLLKHLHQHNQAFLDLRSKEECRVLHESMKTVFDTKLDALHDSIKNLAGISSNSDDAEGGH